MCQVWCLFFFFFQAEDGIRDLTVTGVQTCALPIYMVGGMLVTNSGALAERLGFIQNASGAVPGPFDCWLALRGTKTLALRMRQHDANARRIAEWLPEQPQGQRGLYSGAAADPPEHAGLPAN